MVTGRHQPPASPPGEPPQRASNDKPAKAHDSSKDGASSEGHYATPEDTAGTAGQRQQTHHREATGQDTTHAEQGSPDGPLPTERNEEDTHPEGTGKQQVECPQKRTDRVACWSRGCCYRPGRKQEDTDGKPEGEMPMCNGHRDTFGQYKKRVLAE